MPRRSLQIAREHGRRLPAFASQVEAERALFPQRDERLARIRRWAVQSGKFVTDGTPESLKALEAWYFEVVDNRDVEVGATRSELKESIGAYFGQVLCASSGFEWIVGEDAFAPGHYAIGVRKTLCTVWVSNGISPTLLNATGAGRACSVCIESSRPDLRSTSPARPFVCFRAPTHATLSSPLSSAALI